MLILLKASLLFNVKYLIMSQDHFLSKVYESVLNKTATPSNKPQNLKQAYYRVILEQINEDTEILMQNKDENGKPVGDLEEFSVTDNVANKIRSQIGISGSGFKDIMDALFLKAGIKEKTTSNAYNNASRSIRWFLYESDFSQPLQLFQSSIKNNGFINLLSKTNKFNLLSDTINVAKEKIKKDFNVSVDETALKSFFAYLIKDKPELGGRLGDAEFFCSLFTDAKLSGGEGEKKVGDLRVENTKIEVKATGKMGGRLSGDGTANRAMAEIPKKLKDKFKHSFAKIETTIQNLRSFETIVNQESQKPDKKVAFEKIKQSIENNPALLGKLVSDKLTKINLLDDALVKFLKREIEKKINSAEKKLQLGPKLKGGVERKLDNLLYSAISSIKNDENITMENIIEIIFLTNNYNDPSIKKDLKQFLPQTPQSFFELYDNNLEAINNLIGAMHLCSYTRVSGFDKLMVINSNSFNSLIFDAPKNLESALKIVQTPGIEIDCSVDVPTEIKAQEGEGKGGTEIGKSVFFSYKA